MTTAEGRYPWGSAYGSTRIGRARRVLSWLLLAIAGSVDAIGFLLFAGLYVSFMSGDATQTGVKLGQGRIGPFLTVLAAQALFVAGAAIGQVVQNATRGHRRVVLLWGVTALLTAAAIGGAALPVVAFVCAVVAMGAQNSVMHQEAGTPVGTMVTGTLVRLGEGIVEALRGRPGAVADDLGQWAAFAAGALVGALCWTGLGAAAFAVPAVLAAGVAVAMGVRDRRAARAAGTA